MRIKSTSKNGGVLVELGPRETRVPAQIAVASPLFNLKHILVPLDFSDCSKYALQYAASLARQFGAELQLLHVIEPYPPIPEMYPIDVETVQDSKAELDALRRGVGEGVRSTVRLCTGAPHAEITQAARELKSDLIVIATHGRKGITRMFLGSTTEKIVRQAPCPVLVVREIQPVEKREPSAPRT